ncbi:TPA: hypothetical protein N0F65_011092 [Lagenidium giganteum]|uniref:MULE transposase domain-containing protein n=1 Tax=Lagenidium giganteum TaxID=4803 RepID=A0AAV2ZIC2_9STRA|nr:TPA: hypothetical protein N0F65_011092 [Lagenidium giganteum]
MSQLAFSLLLPKSPHYNSGHQVRLTKMIGPSALERWFVVSMRGFHASQLPGKTRTGISPVVKGDVDALILLNGPGKCREAPKRKYQDDPDKLIPTASQLRRESSSCVERLLVHLSRPAKSCDSLKPFFGHLGLYDPEGNQQLFEESADAYKDELLVLRTIPVVLSGVDSIGIVVSTRRLMRNICTCIADASSQWGDADGFGFCCVVYGRNEYAHRFVPWAYMFTRTESKDAYVQLFEAVTLSPQREIWPIKNALNAVWPDVTIMACWSHISRNVRDKKHLLMPFDDHIHPHILLLHHSRSSEQFARLFRDQYAKSEWCNSVVNCSGLGGLTPNQNPIEAFHNSIKKAALISPRATTSRALWMRLFSTRPVFAIHDLVSFHPGQFHNRLALLDKSNHKLLRAPGKIGVAIVFNAGKTLVCSDSVEGVKVTANRIKVFTFSLIGKLKPVETSAKNVPLVYHSLHYLRIQH